MHIKNLKNYNRNMLARAGITTDEQLIQMTYNDLMKVRYIGHSAIKEINEKVRIPMGLEPLVRPEVGSMHPNNKTAIDAYWERYRKGEAKNGRNRRRA